MKPISSLGLAGVLFANASFAVSPICGLYGGLLAQVGYAPSINLNFPTITEIPVQIDYKILGGGGGQLGYRITNNFRVEFQGLINSNKFNKIRVNNITIPRQISKDTGTLLSMSGNTSMLAGFINAYYDRVTLGKDCNFAPYLGLGIGYIGLKSSLKLFSFGVPVNNNSLTATESGAAAQGIAGFSYFLDDWTWASMDYRYITTNNIKNLDNIRYQLHTLNFSINFSFDGFMS